jgi:hypothetical protein
VTPTQIKAAPFTVRVRLDDAETGAPPAGRQRRTNGDLHRPRQGQPCHPQGSAAADRGRELHQSVLSATHFWMTLTVVKSSIFIGLQSHPMPEFALDVA